MQKTSNATTIAQNETKHERNNNKIMAVMHGDHHARRKAPSYCLEEVFWISYHYVRIGDRPGEKVERAYLQVGIGSGCKQKHDEKKSREVPEQFALAARSLCVIPVQRRTPCVSGTVCAASARTHGAPEAWAWAEDCAKSDCLKDIN